LLFHFAVPFNLIIRIDKLLDVYFSVFEKFVKLFFVEMRIEKKYLVAYGRKEKSWQSFPCPLRGDFGNSRRGSASYVVHQPPRVRANRAMQGLRLACRLPRLQLRHDFT